MEAPDYSQVSEEYASARPTYPTELFEWLAAAVPTGQGSGGPSRRSAGGTRSRPGAQLARLPSGGALVDRWCLTTASRCHAEEEYRIKREYQKIHGANLPALVSR